MKKTNGSKFITSYWHLLDNLSGHKGCAWEEYSWLNLILNLKLADKKRSWFYPVVYGQWMFEYLNWVYSQKGHFLMKQHV